MYDENELGNSPNLGCVDPLYVSMHIYLSIKSYIIVFES